MLDGLSKWLKIGRVTDALKVTRNRDAWKVMIVYTSTALDSLIECFHKKKSKFKATKPLFTYL